MHSSNKMKLKILLSALLIIIAVNVSTASISLSNSTENNNTSFTKAISKEYSNAYACNQRFSGSPWCLPDDFDPEVEPWKYRDTENATSLPWQYQFKFDILDLKEINDIAQTITIMMYLRIKWHEPRIVIDETSSDWNQPYPGISHSPQLLQYLWYPDLEIYEFERFGSKSILKEMSDIQIFKDKSIRYNARVDTKISCQMNFDSYPMDAHHCPFRIGSYYGTDDTVTCTSEYEYFEDRQRSLQYDIEIEPLPEKYRKWNIRKTHRFDTCGFNILINRMRTQIVFQVYLTSAMFVIVSWVSFIIRPEVVPGRIGLLVTIFLVLVNIFNGVKTDAPVSHSLNAVDLYLVVCIGHVFLVLAEYAIVLFLEAKHSTGDKSQKIVGPKQDQLKRFRGCSKGSRINNGLDRLSLIIFPFCFMFFNLIYLCNYF